MKKILLIIALMVSAVTLRAQVTPSGSLPYKSGEEIEFSISFIAKIVPNIDMAKLSVKVTDDVVDGVPAYYISAFARTTVGRWAFKMDNYYLTWIDKKTHLPLKAACEIKEGSYIYNNEYQYDWDDMELRIKANRPGKYEDKMSTLPLEDGTRDIVSLIYSLRSAEIGMLKEGEVGYLTLLNQESVRHLKYRYAGQDTTKIKGFGEVKTRHLICEITTREGEPFEDGNDLHLWLTDDPNRIPVFVDTPIKWGRLRARLVSYKNLKFPDQSVLK